MNEHFKNDAGERVLSGRYRIIRPLATGGMARVFLAEDLTLQRQVAVKVIHPHLAEDPSFLEKFRREAITAAKLNHPNLVNIFDQGSDGSSTYLVMEYVSGRTLRDVLNDFGALSSGRALDVIEAMLAGLTAAHQAGILHRDIKPENVLLADDGRIKLSDFGLARPISAHTDTESVIGTAAYLSPELVTRGLADARSDVYATGILLYELVTGRQPFTGHHAAAVAAQHASSSVTAPSLVNQAVPELVDEIVLYATERNPDDRPADASALLQIVRRARIELKSEPRSSQAATAVLPKVAPVTANATELIDSQANHTEVISPISSTKDAEQPLGQFAVRNRFAKWLVATFLAIILGAGVGWWFGAGPGALRAVPSLQSRDVATATAALKRLGFEVSITEENSATIESGLVTHTSPSGGSLAVAGIPVKVFVSLGPELKVVPKLSGLDVATATQKIIASGFTFGGAEAWFSPQPAGLVFDYLGSDGIKVPAGSAVTIKISLGPLPMVSNIPQDVAVGLLTEAGLKVGAVSTEYSDTVAAGNIINIVPQSQPIGQGGTVDLVVSKGSQKVTMPTVVGETIAAAQSLLQSIGLRVVVDTNKLQSQYGIAKVKKVSVPAGTVLRKGDSVTIISR